MAKRRRTNPLAKYGYPKESVLRTRAQQLANASLPTVRSINRQYTRQSQDVTGFGNALVSVLQGQQAGMNGAYSDALKQQQALAAAARAELAGLSPEYAGAAVVNGAAADSGTSRLLANQAAASAYGAALPGIGAARTNLEQLGVQSAQRDALQQRSDAFRQATLQAFQQLQQNAQQMALANRSDVRQQQQMITQQRQFEEQMQFNEHQAELQNQQFYDRLKFDKQQAAAAARNASGYGNLSASKVQDLSAQANDFFEKAWKGIPNPNYNTQKYLHGNGGALMHDKNGKLIQNPDYDPNPWTLKPHQPIGEVFRHVATQMPAQIAMQALRNWYPPRVIQMYFNPTGYKANLTQQRRRRTGMH